VTNDVRQRASCAKLPRPVTKRARLRLVEQSGSRRSSRRLRRTDQQRSTEEPGFAWEEST
jgi:hypothetical protein